MEKMNKDKAFQSFIGDLNHEARIDDTESKAEHTARLLGEVGEDLHAGIQSRERAVALLAKLDIVTEASDDFAVKAAAQNYKTDIKSRYPDLFK